MPIGTSGNANQFSQKTKANISRTPMINKARTYAVFHPSGAVSPKLKAAENMPIPQTVRNVPTISNRLMDLQLSGSLSVQSFGMVKNPMIVKAKNIMAINQNDARHPRRLVANPPKMVPSTNPIGLPAEKQANAAFFRRLGFSYATPNMPTAGGTALAENRPRTPVNTSRLMGLLAKPAARAKTEYRNSDPTNSVLRPEHRQ